MRPIYGLLGAGSCGVGSINYGVLRDPGNVTALRLVTMEAEPRVLELRGEEAMAAIHACQYTSNSLDQSCPGMSWIHFDRFLWLKMGPICRCL